MVICVKYYVGIREVLSLILSLGPVEGLSVIQSLVGDMVGLGVVRGV